MQQIRSVQVPSALEFVPEGILGTLILRVGREALEQVLHLSGNMMTVDGIIEVRSSGIT